MQIEKYSLQSNQSLNIDEKTRQVLCVLTSI